MTLTHVERTDVYAVTGKPPLRGTPWDREIVPQQVKVTLHPADSGPAWAVTGVAVHGPHIEPDNMPGAQHCCYYSGDRLASVPDYGAEAVSLSLAAANADTNAGGDAKVGGEPERRDDTVTGTVPEVDPVSEVAASSA